MQNYQNRFFAKEFRPGKWHVYDRNKSHNVPIYGDSQDGNDKPLVFDEDYAIEYLEKLEKQCQPY
jgi:hypothetical protein